MKIINFGEKACKSILPPIIEEIPTRFAAQFEELVPPCCAGYYNYNFISLLFLFLILIDKTKIIVE